MLCHCWSPLPTAYNANPPAPNAPAPIIDHGAKPNNASMPPKLAKNKPWFNKLSPDTVDISLTPLATSHNAPPPINKAPAPINALGPTAPNVPNINAKPPAAKPAMPTVSTVISLYALIANAKTPIAIEAINNELDAFITSTGPILANAYKPKPTPVIAIAGSAIASKSIPRISHTLILSANTAIDADAINKPFAPSKMPPFESSLDI